MSGERYTTNAGEPYDGAFGFCPPIMSVDEAAAALHVCATSIRRLCREGQLRAFKLGRSWRVPRGRNHPARYRPASSRCGIVPHRGAGR